MVFSCQIEIKLIIITIIIIIESWSLLECLLSDITAIYFIVNLFSVRLSTLRKREINR